MVYIPTAGDWVTGHKSTQQHSGPAASAVAQQGKPKRLEAWARKSGKIPPQTMQFSNSMALRGGGSALKYRKMNKEYRKLNRV